MGVKVSAPSTFLCSSVIVANAAGFMQFDMDLYTSPYEGHSGVLLVTFTRHEILAD